MKIPVNIYRDVDAEGRVTVSVSLHYTCVCPLHEGDNEQAVTMQLRKELLQNILEMLKEEIV